MPGLTVTIPGGWYSHEQDAGEFNLLNTDYGQGGLFFWRDMVPVDPDGNVIAGVPSTPEALTDWFTTNPNLTVTEPELVTIGRGIEATTFTFVTAPGARNTDPEGCPDYPPGARDMFRAHHGSGALGRQLVHRLGPRHPPVPCVHRTGSQTTSALGRGARHHRGSLDRDRSLRGAGAHRSCGSAHSGQP